MTGKNNDKKGTTEVWLKQPNRVVTMRHSFDATQGRVLAAIVGKLQDHIQECIDNKSVPQQLELFNNDEFGEYSKGNLILTIPYKDVGVSPKSYNALRESLRRMADIPVDITVRSKDGKPYTAMDHFCTPLIPEDVDVTGMSRDKRYEHSFKVMISEPILNYLLDSRGGWHTFLRQVVMTTKNKYAFRFYLLISAWKNKGCTPEFTVKYLREWLKMEDKCQRWNMFVARVINPARDELERLCEEGLCDVYFLPEFIYKDGKKRGEPAKIKFRIFSSSQEALPLVEEEETVDLDKLLLKEFAQTAQNRKDILSLVTEENRDDFLDYCKTTLPDALKKKGDSVKALSSYSYTALIKFLRDWSPAQAIITQQPSEGMLDRHAATVAANTYTADSSAELWTRVLAICRERWSPEEVVEWLDPLEYQGRQEDKIYIKMPNAIFGRKMFQSGIYGRLMEVFHEVAPAEEFALH